MNPCFERLRFLQNEIGITQKDLAEVLRVNPVVISNWKNGTYHANPEHMAAMDRVIEYVRRMKVSQRAKRFFALGYLRGAARG